MIVKRHPARELRRHHQPFMGLGWRGDPQGRPEDLVFRKDDGRTERNKRAAFREWFAYRLQKYAKAVEYREHVFPHLLRSSAATDLSERGASDRDIMDQGAWKTMASLQGYLRVDPEARRERLRESLDL
ncbi:MAG: tyrosine-type recombinase/integrase [Thermoplasmata archaeon]